MRGFRTIGLFIFGLLGSAAFGRTVYHGRLVNQLPLAPEERSALAKTSAAAAHYFPHPTGVRTLAALLVDFSDSPADIPAAEVDSALNQPGYSKYGNKGSVRDFYLDFSRGKLDLKYKVYGYYRAAKAKTYYETKGNYAGGDELLDEVIKAFNSTVDYQIFGSPGEVTINSIAVLYAGEEHDGDLWGTTTWSDAKVDARTAGRAYWASIGKGSIEIATFSHEMGHMLFDWPDLYNVPKAAGGVDAHSLMGAYADVHNPIPPDEALLADQAWIDAVDLSPSSNGIYPSIANANKVYRLTNPAKADESFFVVNRKNTGRYGSLDGKGMLIFHFDMAWNDSPDGNKSSVTLVQDLGKIKPPSNWAEPGWYFYSSNMPEFSYAKQAAWNDWHDGSRSTIRLHSISALSDTMTFSMGDASVALRPGARDPGGRLAGGEKARSYSVNGARSGQRPGTLRAPGAHQGLRAR